MESSLPAPSVNIVSIPLAVSNVLVSIVLLLSAFFSVVAIIPISAVWPERIGELLLSNGISHLTLILAC